MKHTLLYVLCVVIALASCQKPVPIPLPRAYPRIEFPERSYERIAPENCPFSMEVPSYLTLRQRTETLGEPIESDCWYDLHSQTLNADIHCSYSRIINKADYEKRVDDAFELSRKHVKRADFIDELAFTNEHGVSGVLFLLDGPSATPAQFFVSDTTNHFFRGSLYLSSQVNPDSTAPVYEFLLQDLDRLVASFRWEE